MSRNLKTVAVREISSPVRFDPTGEKAAASSALPAWRRRMLGAALLVVALCGSRVPLAPRHLISFDEINFALSIGEFNPLLHQPQPPGYPLFVGLLKLLALSIPKVEIVFLVAALLLSLASLALLWALGEQMLGNRWGLVAALLLVWNPAFWLSALTNPVRLGLAAGATGVALCLFVALRRQSGSWFIAASAVLGLAAGFRPTLLVEMVLLMLWTAWSLRLSRKAVAASLAAFCLAVSVWLPFLLIAPGGLVPLYRLLTTYASDQTGATSFLMGAPVRAAIHMALEAIEWSCLGVLSWIWAVPSAARRRPPFVQDTRARHLLLIWFLPGLAFSALFHVGDPDQTLAIVPATCLVGAGVLSVFAGASVRARAALVSAALLLNVFLFFKPITRISKASTETAVRWADGYIGGLIDGISRIPNTAGVTVVFPRDVPGWRNVSYYLPRVLVFAVGGENQGSATVYQLQARRASTWKGPSEAIPVPSCGILALADPGTPSWEGAREPTQVSRDGILWVFPAARGLSFRSRGFRFASQDLPCPESR